MRAFDYLIIGNSAAAIGAVEAIREAGADGSVAVVSDEQHHVYSRPRISERLTHRASAEWLSYRPLDFYQQHGVTPILGATAVEVDPARKTVRLKGGRKLEYRKLLLATGTKPAQPPIPGIGLAGVYYFTTFRHASELERDLAGIRQAVVIGAGFIGLQAAEALSRMGVQVAVVEALDRVLPATADEYASSLVQKTFEGHGVTILTSCRVAEIFGGANGRVSCVGLSGGKRLDCQAVVVAAGVVPRMELALSAGIETDAGIAVNELMETSEPDVCAAGDVAEALDLLTGKRRLMPIWPKAYAEGRTAGLAMAGRPAPYPGSISMNVAHLYDFPVMSAGEICSSDGCIELAESNERTWYYRRIVLRDNVPVGAVMTGDATDRAGLVVSLIRERADASPFLDKLARPDFNNAHLPPELRMARQGRKT